MSGMSRSGALAVFSSSTRPAIITNRAAPIRPGLRRASRRFARRACAMAIVAYTCCCNAKAGASTSRRPTGFTMSLASNCARSRPSGESKRSYATIGSRRPNRMRHGQWTSCTISWRPAERSGCSRSSIRSPASLRSSIRASAIGPRTSCRRWNAHAPGPATRRRSASIRAQSLCRAIWIFGLMRKASPWTFRGRASPLTMRSSKRSMADFGQSA